MAEKLLDINLKNEIEKSFLDYAMSVIVSRALPDVRDGFKPVHRRIIYSMYELGLTPDKQYRKCARIVGDVLGKYHPHGDSSVYDALVRLAQDFSIRYMLVDGHGNFGSIDGDSAAAMRYTEAKLSKIAAEMIRDIGKDTIDKKENFDGSEQEPVVLPARFPNLIVNGTSGIAVGMATNIPPHNLNEVIEALVATIDNPDITLDELLEYIKGPDFPTGATILGNAGIRKAYETGKGIITIRSNAAIEEMANGKQRIIITEIPYQVNKANLITRIAELVRDKVIDGITDLRDESNRDGIKIVIELRKDSNSNVILNNLFKHTSLQTTYGINTLALADGQPRILSLKELLIKYLDHQREIIIRRTRYDLDKAENRAHIVEGLKIALDNIDEIIKTIKSAKNDEEANQNLINKFSLTEIQSKAILEMKLRRLTGLEREKIEEEYLQLLETIKDLKDNFIFNRRVSNIIKEELTEVKNKYGDERRTKIDMTAIDYIEDEALIPNDMITISVTNKGYIKRILVDTYKSQNRGGVGVKGMTTNEEDFVEHLLTINSHDYVMFFTNNGKVYRMKGYEIPEYGRQAKGLPMVNLIPIEKDERVTSILSIGKEDENNYIVFCTQNGVIKKTNIYEFDSIRQTGKIAISLKENDKLVSVKKTDGTKELLIASSNGRLVRFDEQELRPMGRNAAGVKGITLDAGFVIGMETASADSEVLVLTEKGYGKKTKIEEYRKTKRGSKGVKALNVTDKNGNIVVIKAVEGKEELLIVTDSGIIIRISLEQVSTIGRVSQGVRLINLKDDQKVSAASIVFSEEDVSRETSEINY
ncbi:MAG: DNA gyrase subunit A [Bacilli bacterium]|nr:DNA gyrase subunit A [Bacilli bacterium]